MTRVVTSGEGTTRSARPLAALGRAASTGREGKSPSDISWQLLLSLCRAEALPTMAAPAQHQRCGVKAHEARDPTAGIPGEPLAAVSAHSAAGGGEMAGSNHAVWRTVAVLALLGAAPAAAESQSTSTEAYVGLKAGVTGEQAEDGLAGTVGAGGAMLGIPLTDRWTVEFDFWVPQFLETNAGGRHRDVLAGVSIVRRLGDGRVRPHVLFGLSAGSTASELETCFAHRDDAAPGVPTIVSCDEPDVAERRTDRLTSLSFFPVVGAGAAVAVTKRVRIVPEVRADIGLTVVLVRPSIGVRIAF